MLNTYLNQNTVYSHVTGTDERAQPLYAASEQVPCRRCSKVQNVLDGTSRTIQTQHVYYLKNEVHEGDKLDNFVVSAVETMTDISGNVVGYKAVI